MPIRYIATIHIMIEASSNSEASDALSGLLTENGIYTPETGVIDWSYQRPVDCFIGPRAYQVPDDWDRDEDELSSFIVANRHIPALTT